MMPAARSIVYVWDADYPWDVRAEKTCRALSDTGHDVHIVARNREWRSVLERLPEATVHRMPGWSRIGQKADALLGFPAFFNPRWWSLIRRTAIEVSADVLIARDLPLCPTSTWVGRELGVPVILDLAEHYPAMMRALWDTGRHRLVDYIVRNPRAVEAVERYCISRVDHVFTVADEMSERLIGMGVDPERITCVPNVPDLVRRTVRAARVAKPTRDQLQLVYLGLLEVVRGLNDVIDALAILHARGVNASFLIIGSGRDEHLIRERARAARLPDTAVQFTGHIPYSDAMELVAQADIGVLPLRRNEHMDTTLPNKLFDYMSVGLPVLTSDTTPSARLVLTEGVGRVFAAGDAADLARGIVTLLDPTVRQHMGNRGLRAVEDRYNWGRVRHSLTDAVERVAASGDEHQRTRAQQTAYEPRVHTAGAAPTSATKIMAGSLPEARSGLLTRIED